jgi:hypothetical protein
MGVIMATTHAPRRHGLPCATCRSATFIVLALLLAVVGSVLVYGMTRPSTPWAFDRQEAQYSVYHVHNHPGR